jgi:hypothetical protein
VKARDFQSFQPLSVSLKETSFRMRATVIKEEAAVCPFPDYLVITKPLRDQPCLYVTFLSMIRALHE